MYLHVLVKLNTILLRRGNDSSLHSESSGLSSLVLACQEFFLNNVTYKDLALLAY